MPTFEIDVDPHLYEMLLNAEHETIISCLEEVSKHQTDVEEKRDELRRKRQGKSQSISSEELGESWSNVTEVYEALDANEITEAEAKRAELKLKRRQGGSARKNL